MVDTHYEKGFEEVNRIHAENARRVVESILKNADLSGLEKILKDKNLAKLYKENIPRYAELCDLDQKRGLTPSEKAELAVKFGSLYPTFGTEGSAKIAGAWQASKPKRQAKGS